MLNLPFLKKSKEKAEEIKEELGERKQDSLYMLQNTISELSTTLQEVGSRLKTIEERTRKIESTVYSLKESVDVHTQEINTLKSNFDKLIAIYELIANSVNPFVETPKPKPKEIVVENQKEQKIEKEERSLEIDRNILPLDRIDRDPIAIAVLMGWLNYMVERAGVTGAKRALEYYKLIGWITDKVYIELLKYLQGFRSDKHSELSPEDHIVSLYFITKLKKGVAKLESYRKIYEELIEKGIMEPKLE